MEKPSLEDPRGGFDNGDNGGEGIRCIDRFPQTEDEVKYIEDALAQSMAKVSVDEEERILFEMYGFPSGIDTDEEVHSGSSVAENTGDIFRSSSVSQFKNQREKLSHLQDALEHQLDVVQSNVRDIFHRTIKMNPSFLYQQGLLFVAAVKDEVQDDNFIEASKLLLDHLEVKSELFSENVLARHVEWTDLNTREQELVSNGVYQFGTSPDALGRMVLHCTGHRVSEILDKGEEEGFAKSLQRSMWYTVMSGLQSSPYMLNNGLVVSVCNISKPLPFHIAKGIGRVFWRLPFRLRCIHIFLTSRTLYVCYRALQLASSVLARGAKKYNFHTHVGTSILDIKVKMMSFGVDPAGSPWAHCSHDATGWSRQTHQEWLERQKARERQKTSSSKEGSTGFSLSSSEIRPFDVLLGREKKCTEHLGTRRCKMMVGQKLELYEASNVQEKTKIANDIVDDISGSGGRFLRFENGGWSQVSMKVARQKVAHSFRFLRGKGRLPLNNCANC